MFSNCCRHKTRQLRTDVSHHKFVSAQQAYLHHIKVHVPAALAGSVSNVSSGVPERSKSVLTTAERCQCHVLLWRKRIAVQLERNTVRSALADTDTSVSQRVVSNLGVKPSPHHQHPRGGSKQATPSQGFSNFLDLRYMSPIIHSSEPHEKGY